ncbi:helix-turn-helix domain-containing protein [Hugenholtzia roseola]|uniref:helix-turn-helix domain-containing protein n=1 Tax=Hugenholtzia roseola TaxID=1002 RepID=UPI000405EE8A|nr:helix-turn-helix transcriptional regulator [Hugenholtzia roseola]
MPKLGKSFEKRKKQQGSKKNANFSMLRYTVALIIFVGIIENMEKHTILVQFGKRVRELRKAQHLSQEALSFKANLHRTYIGMIERAEKNITLVNISKIASALGVSIDTLMKFEDG